MLFNKDEDGMELSVEKVKKLLDKKEIVLLDVREDNELLLAKIKGSIHIPVNELKARLDELNRKSTIVTYCHHGVRSLYAAKLLDIAGFNAKSMKGGIAEWSAKVDKNVPVYF